MDILARFPLPVPNLRVYSAISLTLFVGCLYYSHTAVTTNPNWGLGNATATNHSSGAGALPEDWHLYRQQVQKLPRTLQDMFMYMASEAMCIWILINMTYCMLLLLGKAIQRVVFGELRISEQQHVKDKFWNMVFYKFIFIFGIISAQYLNEVILWLSYFTVLGFLHILALLCKDRFQYLSQSASMTTSRWTHLRVVILLAVIFAISCALLVVCICVGLVGGINTFAFMTAECLLLGIRTLHVLVRYCLFLNEIWSSAMKPQNLKTMEMAFEVTPLLVDLLHHVHMLFWSNIFLSMASLVVIMQLRFLIHELQAKIKRHRNYLWVLNHMKKTFPEISGRELNECSDTKCAICWDQMTTARKLPCGHVFHNSCLQSWLEQDTSCPTCRMALVLDANVTTTATVPEPEQPQGVHNNRLFRFNASRYVSWLPNFSVEVTHTNGIRHTETLTQNSQMEALARQAQQMFPQLPISAIIADLEVTRSLELTIDNILEQRLTVPPEEMSPAGHRNALNEMEESPESSRSSSREATPVDAPAIPLEASLLADVFSESSAERELILANRKELLLSQARKRYLDRNLSPDRN